MREWANLVKSSSLIICGRTLKPTAIVIAPFQLIHHRCGLLARRRTFGGMNSSATKTAAALIGTTGVRTGVRSPSVGSTLRQITQRGHAASATSAGTNLAKRASQLHYAHFYNKGRFTAVGERTGASHFKR